jgi:hypothetical protein
VLTSEPVAVPDSVQVALKLSVPLLPAIVFVVVAMLPLPLALWQVPPAEAEQVQVHADRLAGNGSLTDTPLTATVAGFVTTIEYVVLLPALRLLAPSLALIDRSARGTIVSVSVALLFAGDRVVHVARGRRVRERAGRGARQRAGCAEAQRAAAAGDRVRRRRDVAAAARDSGRCRRPRASRSRCRPTGWPGTCRRPTRR